jgi:hypothetical protein
MTTQRQMGSPANAVVLGIAFAIVGSACGGQSTSSAKLPTPAVAPSPPPAASPPAGGPVPAQLLGSWYLPPASVVAMGDGPCPSSATAANCFFRLTFYAAHLDPGGTFDTYAQAVTAQGGTLGSGSGNVVVNNNEIDFFNGVLCGLKLPDGVGRYTWTLTGGLLTLTLISDPCERPAAYTSGSFSRTP